MYARDGGLPPNFAKALVRVEVQDVNDNAPVFARPWYSLEVPENQPPVQLCFLKATDPDSGPGGELEYRITGENRVLYRRARLLQRPRPSQSAYNINRFYSQQCFIYLFIFLKTTYL